MTGPPRGWNAVAAGLLVLEAITVMLAVLVAGRLSGGASAGAVGALAVVAVLLVVAAATVRRRHGLVLPGVLQVATVACGALVASSVLAAAVVILGLAFGGLWVALLRMRRPVAPRTPASPAPPPPAGPPHADPPADGR